MSPARTRTLARHLAAVLTAAMTAGLLATAASSDAAPPRAADVPFTDPFRSSRPVSVGDLEGTGISGPLARAVRIRGMRFDVVERDGVPTARVRTTVRSVLPARPRYRQTLRVAFDEERVLVTNLATEGTRFVPGSGGPPVQGCAVDGDVDGQVVTQWVRLSCLLTDTSEMGSTSSLRSVRTGREVSNHGRTPSRGPFLRWR